ncbi:MAG: ribosome maturation factor RimM [Candidatus Izimaplasma sp.]|nr:ribosome maturation factor RimM [Candidatus Izimaplasma bacterium]
MQYKLIAKVIGFKGLKGEIKIRPFSAFLFERLKPGNTIYLSNGKDYIKQKVKDYSLKGKQHLLILEELDDIELVEDYNKYNIYMDESFQLSLSENEFHEDDLIGLKVYQNKELKGEVIDIKNFPGSDYLVVKTINKNVLIPFRDEFIIYMDDIRIDVVIMEGLF